MTKNDAFFHTVQHSARITSFFLLVDFEAILIKTAYFCPNGVKKSIMNGTMILQFIFEWKFFSIMNASIYLESKSLKKSWSKFWQKEIITSFLSVGLWYRESTAWSTNPYLCMMRSLILLSSTRGWWFLSPVLDRSLGFRLWPVSWRCMINWAVLSTLPDMRLRQWVTSRAHASGNISNNWFTICFWSSVWKVLKWRSSKLYFVLEKWNQNLMRMFLNYFISQSDRVLSQLNRSLIF